MPGETPTPTGTPPQPQPQPAAAPPNPEPPKPPVTPPAADPPPKRMIEDPLLAKLFDASELLVEAEKKADDPPQAPPIAPAPEPAPAAKSYPDTQVTTKPKVTVRPREDARKVAEEVFDRKWAERQSAPPLPPPKTKEEPAPPPAQDDSALSPEQLEEIEDARFAETLDPKAKGKADALRKFYADTEAFVKAKSEEDPDFDPAGPEVAEYVKKNKPWTRAEREKAKLSRIREEAKREVLNEVSPKLAKLERETLEARVTPAIERQVAAFDTALAEKTKGDDPFESEIYESYRASGKQLANDYLRLAHGVDQFDSQNPADLQARHQWLLQFITRQGEYFAKHGGESRTRDGRRFVTAQEYVALQNAKDAKLGEVWTFGVNDVLSLLEAETLNGAKAAIKAEEDRMAKRGFARRKVEAKSESDPVPTTGPRASASVAPGAAENKGSAATKSVGSAFIKLLDL